PPPPHPLDLALLRRRRGRERARADAGAEPLVPPAAPALLHELRQHPRHPPLLRARSILRPADDRRGRAPRDARERRPLQRPRLVRPRQSLRAGVIPERWARRGGTAVANGRRRARPVSGTLATRRSEHPLVS